MAGRVQAWGGKAWEALAGMRPSRLWFVVLGFGHGLEAVVMVGRSWIGDIIINFVTIGLHLWNEE